MSLQQLRNISDKHVGRSSSSPPTNTTTTAKVISVHDGDTCDLVFVKNGRFERFKSRLIGIDTPELSTGLRALKARDFLVWLSLGKNPADFPQSSKPFSEYQIQNSLNANQELVQAEFQGTGGYGRPLVTLKKYQGRKSFNNLLIDYGYATKYR
jgi:endonuclease YncB( thermonuclease family)